MEEQRELTVELVCTTFSDSCSCAIEGNVDIVLFGCFVHKLLDLIVPHIDCWIAG